MGILEILLVFFLGIQYSAAANPGNDCSTSFCGNNNTSPPVRFPFKFQNQTRKECGYPGFDLGCNFDGIITLNLPNSGEFYVRHINYLTQEIQLYDPQGCLPGRLLNLNLSTSSTFSAAYYNNYTFLGCPPDYLDPSLFQIIGCLSNNTISVIATSSPDSARAMMRMCSVIATVAVPSSWPFQNDNSIGFGLLSDLSTEDVFLSWKVPDCRACEARGGSCSFQSGAAISGGEIVCSTPPLNGWRRGETFLKIIGFSVFLPFMILPTLFMGIVCCKCFLAREQHLNLLHANNNNNLNNPDQPWRFSAAMIPQSMAMATNAKAGLDDSVIESYPKLVLSESCSNLVGVGGSTKEEDLICWICLDEYHPGETLRCLPNCKHFFHIECIDQWLKINGTCPVCRI